MVSLVGGVARRRHHHHHQHSRWTPSTTPKRSIRRSLVIAATTAALASTTTTTSAFSIRHSSTTLASSTHTTGSNHYDRGYLNSWQPISTTRRHYPFQPRSAMASTTNANNNEASSKLIPGRPTWQQTMLRIKDPKKSLDFYCNQLGFTLIDTLDFPQYDFSLYFITHLPPEEHPYTLLPGTQAAHDYLWSMEGTALELTHNYGTETQDDFSYHAGNQERDGFGHVAVRYEQTGVVLSPMDFCGVLPFVCRRRRRSLLLSFANFSQTMLRVQNPQKSLEFYRDYLGMQLVRESHYPEAQFSLYFLASSSATLPDNGDARNLFGPVLELTHNHGTETQADFRHFTGNEDDRKGFGHVGFLVDNVYEACDALRPLGYGFKKVCPVCVCVIVYVYRTRGR